MTTRTLHLAIAGLVSTLTLLDGLLAVARADDCSGSSARTVASGPTWVELRHEPAGWQALIAPRGPEHEASATTLAGLAPYREHGHLVLVAGPRKEGFAVIDGGAGLGDGNRIAAYDERGALRALWGLADFMTPEDLASVRRSISHTQWLAGGEDAVVLRPDGAVSITLGSGRVLTLVLGARPTLR